MSGDPHVNVRALTEAEIEAIVSRVTQRVMENFYQEVGKSVVKKMLQIIGLGAVALSIFMAGGKLRLWGN